MLELSGVWLSLAIAFATHFVADFGFQQSDWMALGKSRGVQVGGVQINSAWEILVYHVSIYTAVFVLMASFTELRVTCFGLVWIFGTHYVIDALKGPLGVIKKIWIDQALHLAALVPAVFLGWL